MQSNRVGAAIDDDAPVVEGGTPGAVEFSLVTDDPLHRAQRALGLIPKGGFGLGRRAVIAVAVTWLPLVLWALWNRLLLPGVAPEPMLQHFGIHARFLIALPLFFVTEALVEHTLRRVLSQFVSAGLVDRTIQPRFVAILRDAARMRSSRPALVVIVAFIGLQSALGWGQLEHNHELNWAMHVSAAAVRWDFAAWWFYLVSRPIFLLVLLVWIWRMVVVSRMFWKIAQLDLRLAPTHPDRAGGLGFVDKLPAAFAPFFFAVAVVIAGRWAHDALYHGMPVATLEIPAGVLVLSTVVLGLLPLTVFVGKLSALKRRSMIEVGGLLAEYGRLFERRWFRHETVNDSSLLGAPEIGPVADTVALYEAVRRMRIVPFSSGSIVPLALAAAVPLVPVFATQVPLKQVILKLLSPLLGL